MYMCVCFYNRIELKIIFYKKNLEKNAYLPKSVFKIDVLHSTSVICTTQRNSFDVTATQRLDVTCFIKRFKRSKQKQKS